MERVGEGLDGIVVAKVLETRPIEGANKIHQVIVDAGDGEPLEIGCGAFNMSAGDLVPLATIGTVMPNGMEIGRRKMAGVWSNGMLCSSPRPAARRSEEHTSELQSLMRISYAVFCLKKKKRKNKPDS